MPKQNKYTNVLSSSVGIKGNIKYIFSFRDKKKVSTLGFSLTEIEISR